MSDASVASREAAPAEVAKRKRVIESVTAYSRGPAIFNWPLFVVPLLMGVLVHFNLIGGKAAAWTCIVAYFVVMNAVEFNLSRIASIALTAVIISIVSLMLAAQANFNIPLFQWVGDHLKSIPLDWSAPVQSVFYLLSTLFFGLFVWELFDSWADGKYVFSKNEFEHFSFGRKDIGYARGLFTVSTSIPDRFKWLVGFGGARIEIISSESGKVVATVDNVIFGSRKGRQIRDMLQSIQVVEVKH